MEESQSSSRKRAREEDENTAILQAKKQEFSSINYAEDEECLYEYEFHDGIGVFDFPWLKEGVTFSSELELASFQDNDDNFAPTSYLLDYSSAVADADNNDKSSSSSSSSSSAQKQQQHENQNNVCAGAGAGGGGGKKEEEEEDRFWSLVVDDLEPLDCVWSSAINGDEQLASLSRIPY